MRLATLVPGVLAGALAVAGAGCGGPQNPEVNSGRNQSYRHPDVLTPDEIAGGRVSYVEGNRTDWKELDLPADGDLTVHARLIPDNVRGQIAVELFDPNGNDVGPVDTKERTFQMLGKGAYLLEIYCPTHIDGGNYRLAFTFRPVAAAASAPTYPPPPSFAQVPDFVAEPVHHHGGGHHAGGHMHANIVLVQRQGTFTVLQLDAGSADGIAPGWNGMVLDGQGNPVAGSDFTIGNHVQSHSCFAVTKALPSELGGGHTVEISP